MRACQEFVDYINGLQGADQGVVELYGEIGKLDKFQQNGIKFSISHAKGNAVTTSYIYGSKSITEVKLTIPKLSGANYAGQVNTTLHEEMHLIDLMLRSDPTKYGSNFAASFTPLTNAINNTTSDIGASVLSLFKKHDDKFRSLRKTLEQKYNVAEDAARRAFIPNGAFAVGADYKAYKKAKDKAWKDIMEDELDYEARNIMGGGIGCLEDIYDALSGGNHRDSGKVLYGHGSQYYRSAQARANEIIANYGALSVTRPDLVAELGKDKPDLVDALNKTIEEMRKKAGTIV